MHVLVAVVCVLVLALLLAEFFVVFLLPRRVKRDPAVARALLRALWIPWRTMATRVPMISADAFLGIFGPLGLLAILGVLSVGVIICFTGLLWADGVRLGTHAVASLSNDLYFSAGAFFSASVPSVPEDGLGRVVQIFEAAGGLSFLAIAIGYLPALFQAFSRRETAVSRLDPRAGSPPTAAALLANSSATGGWAELDSYLHEWEGWTAELMETHLSYPILGWFRSQHVNQNWLAALTIVVDACSYAIAFGPEEQVDGAVLTYRIGRHALADLAYTLRPRYRPSNSGAENGRLTPDGLEELRSQLEGTRLGGGHREDGTELLEELRASYEPYAETISRYLALDLPDWLSPDEVKGNWRAATEDHRRGRLLP